MGRPIKKGSTDQSTVIRIIDSTDGTPETAVAHDTSGIALWYRREGATQTAITEASLAALDSAHSDGGIEPMGDGYYRLDLPDAAWATGANGVMIGGTVTGMIVIGNYHHLVDYDPQDTVRLGLTALPNAAANAAGGLPISAGGGLALDTKLANTHEVTAARMGALTDWIDGGRLDLIVDAILGDTAELQADWVNTGRLDVLIDAIKSKTDSLTFTVAGDVDANVQSWGGAAAPAMTGDAFARLGAPAGASVSADVAAVKSDTAAILVDTGTDGVVLPQAQADKVWGTAARVLTANTNLNDPTAATIADAVWDEAATGHTDAGKAGQQLWTDVDAILADTNELQTDDTPGAIAALNNITADSVWDASSAVLSLSFEVLMNRIYQMTSNKITVVEATGAVALRNIADNADIATGSVVSSSGTTTRAGLSWT